MLASSANPQTMGATPNDAGRAEALMSLLRLHWFIHLRWAILVGGLAALGIERLLEGDVVRPTGLWYIVAMIGVVNVGWMTLSHLLRRRFEETPEAIADAVRTARMFANGQVSTDLLLLTLILRYVGGVEAPMMLFYVFHMVIGSLLLSTWQAVAQGVWAVVLFTGLGVGELLNWITPHYSFWPSAPSGGGYAHAGFVCVSVLVMASCVFFVLFLSLRIIRRIDDQESRLRTTLGALQRSQHAIRDLQARRSRFMLTAAHQLKSPLAGIQTMSNLIRDEVVTGPEIIKTCRKIGRRCREGIVAVTELLTLARVQDADPTRHGEALVDVGAAVHEVHRRRSLEAQRAQVALSCDVPENADLRAHVDRSDLIDCVDNLIENAIKYTPAGGRVRVSVGRRSPSGTNGNSAKIIAGGATGIEEYIAVVVQDTGMGIDPEDLGSVDTEASVFDAYRRGNQALTRGIAGSGLGLSIVRAVVEQASGRLQVYSRPGEGSTFTVMFPAESTLPDGPRVRDTRASEVLVDTTGFEPFPGGPSAEESDHAG